MADADDTAILVRLSDPLRAQMLRDLLENEGIHVATPGLEHRSMLGVIGSYVEIAVRVPMRDLERARELMAALQAATATDPVERDAEAMPNVVLYKRIAAFCAFVLPGGAHLYARRPLSAMLLFAAMVFAGWLIVTEVWLALLLPFVVILFDVAGASWHCDRTMRGADPERGRWRRFAAEIGALAVFAWLFAAPAAAEIFAGSNARTMCRVLADCGAGRYERCIGEWAYARFDRVRVPDACADCLRESTCSGVGSCRACY